MKTFLLHRDHVEKNPSERISCEFMSLGRRRRGSNGTNERNGRKDEKKSERETEEERERADWEMIKGAKRDHIPN